MTTCTATTAAGTRCKNYAVKGTQLCKAHGGSALVPVLSPAADSELRTPNSALDLTVHDPHPNRLPIPDDYTIEDANADLF